MRKWPNGMASASQAGGCGFEPRLSLHKKYSESKCGLSPALRSGRSSKNACPATRPTFGRSERAPSFAP